MMGWSASLRQRAARTSCARRAAIARSRCLNSPNQGTLRRPLQGSSKAFKRTVSQRDTVYSCFSSPANQTHLVLFLELGVKGDNADIVGDAATGSGLQANIVAVRAIE